ncbi:hypothetical protein [Micromonospora auratinigra]|uniref:hypothetical protein n=1 Tax=Micromonospora auratinigra TaxID=261654 RepID=UPI000B327541|nr:hypothetical protein [Micromonospora auratinigra]
MFSRANPSDPSAPPGALIGVVGTVAAIAGALILILKGGIGAVFVIGGLLLRIESAIRGTSRPSSTPEDGPA